MFRSGADKVYWLRTHRTALDRGLSALLQTMEEDGICLQTDCLIMESGGARNFIDPGLFFIIQEHDDTLKPSCSEVVHLADRLVKVTGDGWDILPEYLFFEDGTWGLKESAAAVVLSGGTSSRMGEDKSIMSINEEPLLSTITKQLQPNFESVIISGKKEKHSFFGCDVVEDLEPDKGPLMGLLSSLKYSRHEINFITTCDVPDIHLPFVRKMLREINDHEAIISVMNGKSQPLFAVYKKTVCSVIEQLLNEGKQAVHALLDRIDVMELELEGQWYHNLNTHDDVGRYRKSRS